MTATRDAAAETIYFKRMTGQKKSCRILDSLRSTTWPALLRGLNFRSQMPANNLIKVINV